MPVRSPTGARDKIDWLPVRAPHPETGAFLVLSRPAVELMTSHRLTPEQTTAGSIPGHPSDDLALAPPPGSA
ncbi:hypothetical protein [Nonomuraea sp. NPDC049480]|uniref:hypothetical protein n=1 Tax=Nonomuraea sp. NPDC049480 TaxID=3364353 RepID=UPI00379B08AD